MHTHKTNISILSTFLLCTLTLTLVLADKCSVPDQQKIDCGYLGIQQAECLQKGCCWVPKGSLAQKNIHDPIYHFLMQDSIEKNDIPWCFNPSSTAQCDNYNFSSSTPGFTESFIDQMNSYYIANIDIQRKGGVMASPDTSMQYNYDWMRDESLTMRTYLEINEMSFSKAQTYFPDWVQWVLRVQNEADPFGLNVLIEPKFDLPNGQVYTGPWCRPQTDGPALRSTALLMYANILLDNNQKPYVQQYLWTSDGSYHGGAIKYDLEWVANNWPSSGCDLWEEITSDNFFWNRMAFRYTLDLGAAFAQRMGDNTAAQKYRSAAQAVRETLNGHWNGQYMIESTNRPQDSAVIHAFSSFQGVYLPTDSKIAATINTLNDVFCNLFIVNQDDNKKKIGGMLYGRYPGDVYQGGNPWQLLSSVLGESFYQVAKAMLDRGKSGVVTTEEINAWKGLLKLSTNPTTSEFAQKALSAGDSVLNRIYIHVNNKGGMVDEQMDKVTGVQKSAYSLTWSYANLLRALWFRQKFLEGLDQKFMEVDA